MDISTELGHVHLKVRDLDQSLDFYQKVLGLELTERISNFAFLSSGERHHDVALQALGPDASGPTGGIGLYHAAFEVPDADVLSTIYERLQERDIEVTPVDHRISKALYFDDPDGNGLEVYLDTRERNDREAWRGANQRFDPKEL